MTEKIIYENYSNPRLANYSVGYPREASRGLVFTKNGKMLAFLKAKTGQYKLPGGGREGEESPEETFRREAIEETGYSVKNVRNIGITKGYTQSSHVFLADADEYVGINLDDDEIADDSKPIEITPEDFLKECKKFLDKYADKHDEGSEIKYAITSRDYHIVKYYLENRYTIV